MSGFLLVCPNAEERVKNYRVTLNAVEAEEAVPSVHFLGDVHVEGRIIRDGLTYWLLLEAKAAVELECSRCLGTFRQEVAGSIEQKYVEREILAEQRDDEDQEVLICEDDRLDISKPLMETILLALPGFPVCDQGCKGLCPTCGKRLSVEACGCTQEEDPDFGHSIGDLLKRKTS